MSRSPRISAASLLLGLMAAGSVMALVPSQSSSSLDALVRADERLKPAADIQLLDDAEGLVSFGVLAGWDRFTADTKGSWVAYVDQRNGYLEYAEGSGIPWIPGHGNSLTAEDVPLGKNGQVDLSTLEGLARDFLDDNAYLLGVDPQSLVLSAERSQRVADFLWFVEFDVYRGDLPIDTARVVFRVNNGNLIQFGTENVPAPDAATPAVRLDRAKALAAVASYIGGFSRSDEMIDEGSLHLLPARIADGRFAEGFQPGAGRGLVAVWEVVFRREDSHATWRARVDATTGEVVELYDLNHYEQVVGGVYPISNFFNDETVLPMPFADLSSGGFTNSAGFYNYLGGTVTTTLDGQFVSINDNCGAISAASDPNGDIYLGMSPNDDCDTPGFGGAGNTHSARMQFYHVNRAKEVGLGWLPGNTWLGNQLTANVNINSSCNAFWSPGLGTINFYRSGGGCGNTGEISGVSLHEYGHGLDTNDGSGTSLDRGTGETYGDFTAALQTHNSCIGNGFLGSNCGGYGDPCTDCTGVRDIDWAQHSSATAHTVANFTQPLCPGSSFYEGPCGQEGHCESYVSSEALWDLAERDLPSPGSGAAWTTTSRLWYQSRPTATRAFICDTSGATWTSDGCGTGTYWRTMRAVDDDDGDLTNGTPNGGALYAAFNRHLIACTTDPGANTTHAGCTAPAVPTVTLTPASNQITVSWTSSGAGVVYDVFRNEAGCNAGFTKVANDVAGTSFVDTAVIDGTTYYYQVTAQPTGNEACSSLPSSCQSLTLFAETEVWSQDKPWDTGDEPDAATASDNMWESEDIWVRNDLTQGPHQDPEAGQWNVIWTRVRNMSLIKGDDVPVELWVANASTGLSWPGQWTHVGTAHVDVPAMGTVDVGVLWFPTQTGHFCLVARLDTPQDPMTYTETSSIGYNTRYNNNIVWRNTNVVNLVGFAYEGVSFIFRNISRRDGMVMHNLVFQEAQENLEAPFLERGQVIVTLPPKLAERWRQAGQQGRGFRLLDDRTFAVEDPRRTFIRLPLAPREEFDVEMTFRDDRPTGQGEEGPTTLYTFRVVQEEDGNEEVAVGGVTYKVTAPALTGATPTPGEPSEPGPAEPGPAEPGPAEPAPAPGSPR